jgi:ATP-dependent Lon protease
MTMEDKLRVGPDNLRCRFNGGQFPWNSTQEQPPCTGIIGQERALRAIRLGLEMKSIGYNVFVTGLSGTGKMTTIQSLLAEIDRSGRIPDDLCYAHNFRHPESPRCLHLPAGHGKLLEKEMGRLVEYCLEHVPEILESDLFKKQLDGLMERAHAREKELIRGFEKKVNERTFALVQVQYGTIQRPELMPVIDSKPVALAELEQQADRGEFAADEFERLRGVHKELALEMGEISKQLKTLQKEVVEGQEGLVRDTVRPFVEEVVGEIRGRFPWPEVKEYLADVQADILDRIEIFKEKQEDKSNILSILSAPKETGNPFLPYMINVIIDNSDLTGAPIIIETVPSYRNIFGTIEKSVERSGLIRTDFMQIRAGSLLRANGGYLVLNARDALMEPEVYKNIKRALKYNKVSIQSFEPFPLIASFYLTPEPIDIDVKIVMIGDRELYHVLYQLDEDFRKIFKILADFDSVMSNTTANINCFVSLMSKIIEEERLLHFDREGIIAVLEQAVRMAGRRSKLTTRFSDVADLMREASHWAGRDHRPLVSREHVDRAFQERVFRSNLPEEKLQELIEEGIILIDSDGRRVGQVNGLSVYQLGYYAFGKPSRITAEVSVGGDGVINIEREVGLSGMTHDKGVFIISHILRSRYTKDKPLSMNASVCFEQSYGGVDGDSASSTEVYALLSALSGLPLRQDLAVTGSVNQKGVIQPVGGINEKIEGFFDICVARGLTGTQGVLIPVQNVEDLMLREPIVGAVRDGKFHIYAVATIDEGIELLTGVSAGEADAGGNWPADSVNDRVNRRLQEFADTLKGYKQ